MCDLGPAPTLFMYLTCHALPEIGPECTAKETPAACGHSRLPSVNVKLFPLAGLALSFLPTALCDASIGALCASATAAGNAPEPLDDDADAPTT
eukprot:2654824-Amphidinium_carterae.2